MTSAIPKGPPWRDRAAGHSDFESFAGEGFKAVGLATQSAQSRLAGRTSRPNLGSGSDCLPRKVTRYITIDDYFRSQLAATWLTLTSAGGAHPKVNLLEIQNQSGPVGC